MNSKSSTIEYEHTKGDRSAVHDWMTAESAVLTNEKVRAHGSSSRTAGFSFHSSIQQQHAALHSTHRRSFLVHLRSAVSYCGILGFQ